MGNKDLTYLIPKGCINTRPNLVLAPNLVLGPNLIPGPNLFSGPTLFSGPGWDPRPGPVRTELRTYAQNCVLCIFPRNGDFVVYANFADLLYWVGLGPTSLWRRTQFVFCDFDTSLTFDLLCGNLCWILDSGCVLKAYGCIWLQTDA